VGRGDLPVHRTLFPGGDSQLGNGLQRMPVDGIDMVDVMLRQGHYPCIFGDIGLQHAGLKHRFEHRKDILGLDEQRQEGLRHPR